MDKSNANTAIYSTRRSKFNKDQLKNYYYGKKTESRKHCFGFSLQW